MRSVQGEIFAEVAGACIYAVAVPYKPEIAFGACRGYEFIGRDESAVRNLCVCRKQLLLVDGHIAEKGQRDAGGEFIALQQEGIFAQVQRAGIYEAHILRTGRSARLCIAQKIM